MTCHLFDPPENSSVLDEDQLDQFRRLGYLILPGFLPQDLVSRLRPEVDRWVDKGLRQQAIDACVNPGAHRQPPMLELEMSAHGELIGHPPLMAILTQLMGPGFAFHHLHSDRQAASLPGKEWHHDYEQRSPADRAFVMVHALHYLNGLDEHTSSLVVLPGSQVEVTEKSARAHLGTAELPNEVIIDSLTPGSTVVLHSALFHARRTVPDAGMARYFVDCSYCQAGIRWPPVKPFWRYMLARARELGLDQGKWPDLFAEHHFSEYVGPLWRTYSLAVSPGPS